MDQGQLYSDVQLLRQSLKQLPEAVVKPPFIVVSGLPGTGKSYFCRQLAARLPLTILESDALRQILFQEPSYSPKESSRLFRACHLLVEELLASGIPLALDATNLSERYRERLYHIADRLGAKLIIVRLEAPPALVQQRLEARLEGADTEDRSAADWGVYQRMRTSAQKIQRQHFAADTSRDITLVIDKIMRQIKR